MIDDDFGDDDDGDDDVSLACSKTRQRFWELRTAWVCKLLITESCFAARQTFGAIPRQPGRANKKQTFRKRLRTRGAYHVENLSAIPSNL